SLREAVAAARRAAEEAGAAQAASAQAELQAARNAEQAGEAAFARRAYDEAPSQFRAAERAYQDAARHASAQQAVSAAVAEVERLIAAGHVERALESLARVRESNPKHPQLPKLDVQIKRLEERKRREQAQSLLTQARRLQTQGDVAGALRLAEEAVELAPTDAAAVRLRDELQEALAQPEEATPPPTPAPPRTVPRAPERRAPREQPEPQRVPRQGLGAKQIGIGVAAGLLLIVGAGAYVFWPKEPPRETRTIDVVLEVLPPGTPEQLAGEVTRIDGGKVTIRSGSQTYQFQLPAEALKNLKVGDPVEARLTVKPESGRARAEEARRAMAAARDEAAKAEANKVDAKSWAAAGDREREADAAFGKQDFAGAQAAYAGAREAYARAAKEANDKKRTAEKVREVREQQDQAVQARSRAQGLEAATLAGDLWNKGIGLEKSADEALKLLDLDKALALAKDAEQTFRAAAERAEKQQSEEARAAAAAASEATKARQAAEQVEASRYAKDVFAQAEERLKAGQTASEAKDHRTARTRYGEAEKRYQQAKQDAEILKNGLSARQREAEQSRNKMAQSRSDADLVNAKNLVAKAYQEAAAKDTDAQQLFTRADGHALNQRFREAQQEYERAKQRFGDAQQEYEKAAKEARA
ncbi:MAG TPA: hypothetical protein VLA62_01190, partial [Solirubrobacterales bacterium]|nr:hypothetical protein [Solirubrobacterales bacterium]